MLSNRDYSWKEEEYNDHSREGNFRYCLSLKLVVTDCAGRLSRAGPEYAPDVRNHLPL